MYLFLLQIRNSKTRAELINKLYKDIGRYSSNSSKLSDSDISDKKRMTEMKDEAVQAHFDDIFKAEEHCISNGNDKDTLYQCDSDDKISS